MIIAVDVIIVMIITVDFILAVDVLHYMTTTIMVFTVDVLHLLMTTMIVVILFTAAFRITRIMMRQTIIIIMIMTTIIMLMIMTTIIMTTMTTIIMLLFMAAFRIPRIMMRLTIIMLTMITIIMIMLTMITVTMIMLTMATDHDHYGHHDDHYDHHHKGWITMIDVHESFQARGNPDRLYANDGLHLSADGYHLWSHWTQQALNDLGCVFWVSGMCESRPVRRATMVIGSSDGTANATGVENAVSAAILI